MIENVCGFLDAAFEDYRLHLKKKLEKLGYVADWRLLNASEFGVPQLRPRVVIVALRREAFLLAESGRSQSAKRRGNTLRYDGGQGLVVQGRGANAQMRSRRQSSAAQKSMAVRILARRAHARHGRLSVSTASRLPKRSPREIL